MDFDDPSKIVDYGESGRVKLTTLTKEFFVPGFLERDEGEREPPCDKLPVGRHQRRETVPWRGAVHDGRGVLTLPFNTKDTKDTKARNVAVASGSQPRAPRNEAYLPLCPLCPLC